MRSSFRERAFTLVEVLMAAALVLVGLFAVLTLSISSARMGHGAQRLTDALLHGQTLVELAAALDASDLTALATADSIDLGAAAAPARPGRAWQVLAAALAAAPPLPMERAVTLERSADDRVVVRVRIAFLELEHDPRTRRVFELRGQCAPDVPR